MSNIDKRAREKLQAAAEKAVDNFDPNIFVETRDVLALLDELEAAESRIAELEVVKFKLSDSKLLSLAKDIVENLVDTGGSDPEYTQQYVDWTFKRIRAAAGKGE